MPAASTPRYSRVEGKLCIDEENFGWIKVDGQVTEWFSMGLYVARVQQRSHVILEQTCVGDAVWLPRRLEVRAAARILFVKSLDIDRIFTSSDYQPGTDGPILSADSGRFSLEEMTSERIRLENIPSGETSTDCLDCEGPGQGR